MRIFIYLILTGFCATAYSQGTTETEYLYMKKGYRLISETGSDMKRGYKETKLETIKCADVYVQGIVIRRDNESLVGTILKMSLNENLSSATYYVIPVLPKFGKSFGLSEYGADLRNMTTDNRSALLVWFSYQYMNLMDTVDDQQMKPKK